MAPDHVFLVHEVGLDSVLHLSMGLIGFHTIPFRHRWYVTLFMPITVPIMLAMWAFATPSNACEYRFTDMVSETWVMPRFGFQVVLITKIPSSDQAYAIIKLSLDIFQRFVR